MVTAGSIRCEYCGKIAKEIEFVQYGGTGRVNLGTCKECSANKKDRLKAEQTAAEVPRKKIILLFVRTVAEN